MAEIKKKTTEEKKVKLIPKVWEVPFNSDLVAQVLYVYASNERKGTAKAKTRGDVSGGGRKPWRQKGTGRARHGSIRSPLWTKGGVTFVPNYRNWNKKINSKMKNKATCMMLSERLKNKELSFLTIDAGKNTKETRSLLGKELDKKTLVISSNEDINKALRNMENVKVFSEEKVNTKNLANCKKVIVDNKVIKILEDRLRNGK
jgi:large subunit ribosomal protein L4